MFLGGLGGPGGGFFIGGERGGLLSLSEPDHLSFYLSAAFSLGDRVIPTYSFSQECFR